MSAPDCVSHGTRDVLFSRSAQPEDLRTAHRHNIPLRAHDTERDRELVIKM